MTFFLCLEKFITLINFHIFLYFLFFFSYINSEEGGEVMKKKIEQLLSMAMEHDVSDIHF